MLICVYIYNSVEGAAGQTPAESASSRHFLFGQVRSGGRGGGGGGAKGGRRLQTCGLAGVGGEVYFFFLIVINFARRRETEHAIIKWSRRRSETRIGGERGKERAPAICDTGDVN